MGAASVETALLAIVGLSAAVVTVLVLRHWPRLTIIAWMVALCFLPYWAGVTAKVFLPPTTLASVVVVAALLPVRRFRFHPADVVPLLLVLSFLVAAATGASAVAAGFTLVLEWIPAYVVGRLVATELDMAWVYGAMAVVLTVVATLALVEFATSYNLFAHLVVGNEQFATWGPLQMRGGELRAEGAFGHSIALGASLAIGIPVALGSTFRPAVKVAMVAVMLAGSVVTFSRIGMVSAVLGLVLSIVFLRGSLNLRGRVGFALLLGLGAALAIPFISTVFDNAGPEASGSAAYRGDLLSTLDTMSPLGLSSSFERTPSGAIYFSTFRSIDSALVLMGLTFGVLPLLLVVGSLTVAVIVVLRGRATPATIAVVAQIPALTTVALVTQYGAFAWFTVGLAVTSQMVRRRPPIDVVRRGDLPLGSDTDHRQRTDGPSGSRGGLSTM